MATAAIGRQTPASPFFNFYTTLGLLFLIGLYVFVVMHIIFDPNPMNYLFLLMLIQLTPFFICFTRKHYNYIAFVMFNHFVTYSLAKFNQVSFLSKTQTLYPETLDAVVELTICSILIICTYFLGRNLFFYRFVERERYQMLSLSRVQLVVVASYVLLIPLFIPHMPAQFLLFHFATIAADMVLLLCANSPGNERFAFWVRLGVFVSAIYYFLGTGALTMVGNLAGYIFIASCLQQNYKRILIPIVLAVLASAIQNVKFEYRNFIFSNPQSTYSERMETLGALMTARYVEGSDTSSEEDNEQPFDPSGEETLSEDLIQGFSRVGDDSLERVMAWTPSKVPYWNGESYLSLPFLLIPRALWPEKPSRHVWNKFGRTYGYLSEDDETTSVGVSYLAEAYMNFGFKGMYAIALIMGFFIAFVERLSYYFLKGYFYFSFMAFLMPVMSYSSDFTSMVNSVLLTSLLLLVFRNQFLIMARKDDYM